VANNGAGAANAFEKAQAAQVSINTLTLEIKEKRALLVKERDALAKYRKEVLAAMSGAKRGPRKKKDAPVQEPLIDARTNKTDD
jgi:hypothetical protein